MNHVVKQKLIWLIPACLCVLIFFLIHLIQKIGAFIIPEWGIIGLSIFIGVIILSYSVRLRLLNRIGGEKFYFWLSSSLSACWCLNQPLINTLNKHPLEYLRVSIRLGKRYMVRIYSKNLAYISICCNIPRVWLILMYIEQVR